MSTTSSKLVTDRPGIDQRIVLHGISWDQFETLLAIRGDAAGVRVTYLDGELELMSPSEEHERIKKTIARLVEAYAWERGIALEGYGSWTIRRALRARGVEPDECYVLAKSDVDRPDLAIEVLWTSGGIDKLEVYRGLEVPEVWMWRNDRIEVFVLRDGQHECRGESELLPDLDFPELVRCVAFETQTDALRAWHAVLRRQ